LAYNPVDSIGWVSYGGWMLKLEGSKWVYLEVYLEKWFLLSALMIFTWHIAERFVHCWYGLWAWELFKAQYAPELLIKKRPPNSPPKPKEEQYVESFDDTWPRRSA